MELEVKVFMEINSMMKTLKPNIKEEVNYQWLILDLIQMGHSSLLHLIKLLG
jgi:hypothetical protein